MTKEALNEYYDTWVEFLKLSRIYKMIIERVESVAQDNPLLDNFARLDFSDTGNRQYWLNWVENNSDKFKPDILPEYSDLLINSYPIFQDVNIQNIDEIIYRLSLIHKKMKMLEDSVEYVSDGYDLICKEIDNCIENYKNNAEYESIIKFSDVLKNKFKDYSIHKDLYENANKDFFWMTPLEDERGYSVLLKCDVRGNMSDICINFKNYFKNSNISKINRMWLLTKNLTTFAYVENTAFVDNKKDMVTILKMKNDKKTNIEIAKIISKSKYDDLQIKKQSGNKEEYLVKRRQLENEIYKKQELARSVLDKIEKESIFSIRYYEELPESKKSELESSSLIRVSDKK
jgi:hypothetical protein